MKAYSLVPALAVALTLPVWAQAPAAEAPAAPAEQAPEATPAEEATPADEDELAGDENAAPAEEAHAADDAAQANAPAAAAEEIDNLAGIALGERPSIETRSDQEIQAEIGRLQAEATLRQARLDAQLAESHLAAALAQAEIEQANTQAQLETSRLNQESQQELVALGAQRDAAILDATIAEARAKAAQMSQAAARTERNNRVGEIEDEISRLEHERNVALIADREPIYLNQPLLENGTLVISDRRIPLNGPIVEDTATFLSSRIQFFNNQDPSKPIFIVIDNSPGGSVSAGYQILNAMDSSEAPIHVIVKGSAASMAAVITTLADESYILPNATLLHHQISWQQTGNLSEQVESMENAHQWWMRLAGPVAEKMGVSLDEFIGLMYENAVDGNWNEFGDQAVELHWVDHLANQVEETAQLEHPSYGSGDNQSAIYAQSDEAGATPRMNSVRAAFQDQAAAHLPEQLDERGKAYVRLPRAASSDRFYLYNPDGYYRH